MHPRRLEEALSMSAYLAFLELRSYLADYPSLTETEAVTSLSRVRASAMGLDFRGGLSLLRNLDPSLDWQLTPDRLRLFVFEWITMIQPPWLRLVPYGREKVRGALNDDQTQCCRHAGLFDETPDDGALEWWDRLADLIRSATDSEKMKRARHAERLSLEFELRRLKCLGVSRRPKWVALEDNSLGYDILSYDLDSEGRVVTRLIEVKSALSGEIFITRNEWENVSSAVQRSVIHVWELPEERLREYRAYDVVRHIPLDQGDGAWQDVRIALPG